MSGNTRRSFHQVQKLTFSSSQKFVTGFCRAFLTGRRSALQASTRDTNNQETTTTKATDLPATVITTRATDLRATTTTTTTDHQAATTTTTRLTGHLRAATATTKATDHHRPATQLSQATIIRAAAAAATGQQAATLTRGAPATGRQVATYTRRKLLHAPVAPTPMVPLSRTSLTATHRPHDAKCNNLLCA